MPIGEALALAGLGWVASPVVKDLVNKSISYLGSSITEGLDDLVTTVLPQIQLTIEAAQHSSPHKKDQLAKWLARLKNAYYDAESILHELEYERLKRKAKGDDKKLLVRLSSKPIIKPLAKFTNQVVKKALVLSPQKRKLLKRLNKLKEVAAEANTFRDLLAIQKSGIKDADGDRDVTSWLLTDKVFGRDGDRDNMINFLLDNGDHYSVFAVTGMGGVGKTTLAQYVYNNPRVEKHFDLRMWLCISGKLNIFKHTKEMIECASGKECPNLRNLGKLQEKLIETLREFDHIMVVLDDVWYDREEGDAGEKECENFLNPFITYFPRGTCKIVVTSRSLSFPTKLRPKKCIMLSDLAYDDFKSLLRYRAIDDLNISNSQVKNDMSDIVDQIAKKMSKSPLAAKVVGNQLRQRPNINFWQATLENVNLSDTMEILLWSFHRFDVQLQRCFLFCSLFPKGTNFGSIASISYWAALDFIQPSDDNRNIEDLCCEYFEIMVANSMFNPVDKTHKWYTMHDLFHDLAEKLSAEDCFTVTNAKREIPSTVQHVYLNVNNENMKENLSNICNLSNLRTFILANPFIDDISEIISKISRNFRNLRVLAIRSRGYKTLPRVVGDLKNLRLLDLGVSSIEELPVSILQLYHLQFLWLPSSIKTLPTKFSNFIKLRSIEMLNTDGSDVYSLPPVPYLAKLTSLQHLNVFHVRKEKGYELQQLEHLKEIGGYLRIEHLENVRDKDEAVEARLIDKLKLKKLHLVWDESAEINGSEVEVIEALRPPTNLELLIIDGYMGSTYPSWLQKDSFIKNIKKVEFLNCNALTTLPQNFQQFSNCSTLLVEELGALRELSTFPESLVQLLIVKCPCLIFVCEDELQMNENQSIMESRFLQFGVEGCEYIIDHELKSFEQTGSKENCTEELQIIESVAWDNASRFPVNANSAWWCCHQQRMDFMFSTGANKKQLKLPAMLCFLVLDRCCVSDGALSNCLRGMASLEELHLLGIMTITTLPPAQVLESLQSLRVVEIKHCWCLRSFGGLHALPHLEKFLVQSCFCLGFNFSGNTPLPSTLTTFTIESCEVPQVILSGHFPCLQNVIVSNCIVPMSLSFRHLPLLKILKLINCPNLFSIQGLESRPFINTLVLFDLPNLAVESVMESWQGCRELAISSSVMLNKLLSSQDFISPQALYIRYYKEELISFEEADHLQSIKKLLFLNCETEYLPTTLSDFSTLETVIFRDCPKISRLPELPSSVQHITIKSCPVLRERCQPNGQDWHKIQYIQDRWIECFETDSSDIDPFLQQAMDFRHTFSSRG